MLMGAMVPGDDDRPAAQRDVAKEREVIEANTRAGFAELRIDMTEGFRKTDKEISAVSAKVDKLRTDMEKGFRKTDKAIAELRVDMSEGFRRTDQAIATVSEKVDKRMTNQARFMAGLLVTMCASLLAEVLGNG